MSTEEKRDDKMGVSARKTRISLFSMGGKEEQILRFWFMAAVLIGVALLKPEVSQAQEQEVAMAGKPLFEDNCMVCHGRDGKGDGIMVTFNLLKVNPPDLTLLSKRNDNHFPFWRVYRIIEGREETQGHGTQDMPLWGYEFRAEAGLSNIAQSEVRGKILSLVYYLQSLQEK